MTSSIEFKAGRDAYRKIKDGGLKPEDIRVIAGAAGGPKWFVLYHLDRVVFLSWLKNIQKQIHLIGASIGAWRFSALTQNQPGEALDRFKEAYIHQYYSERPSPEEVTRKTFQIMDAHIDDDKINQILNHPYLRLNIMAVRCKALTASDRKPLLAAGIGIAAFTNIFSRHFLKLFFDRALFYHPADIPPFFGMNQFGIVQTKLGEKNFRQALLASGSIPVVMQGVEDINGAEPGVYRDGGIIDYHMDLPFMEDRDGIVLFPHYINRVIPGWFDKPLKWRKPQRDHMRSVLLVSPSPSFVSGLPYGKIPDRNDFLTFSGQDEKRIGYWNTVIDESRRIGDEFWDAVDSGRIRDLVQPMD